MKKNPKSYRAIAEYYDPEYEHNEMLEHDVPFMMAHLPKRKLKILELGAGTGRVAIPLAQAGHGVVAVDYAKEMLDIARRKRDGVGLTDRELKLVRADAMKLKLKQKFDWACILFNTFLNFSTLQQQDDVLRGVVSHLKPGGIFWLDIFQPNLALLAQEKSTNHEPHVFYVPCFDRTVLKAIDVERDPSVQVQKVTFRYHWFDQMGREKTEKVKFDLTFIMPRELQLLLERHGLKIVKIYGNYDGSALNSDSPRMITMARKV